MFPTTRVSCTNDAVRLEGAASTLIFHVLYWRRDLATSVRQTDGTAIGLAIFGRYRLDKESFGRSASCKMVSLIVELYSPFADTYIRIFLTIGGILVPVR